MTSTAKSEPAVPVEPAIPDRTAVDVADMSAAGPPPWRPGWVTAALIGLISIGLAIGIAELLAALGGRIRLFDAVASPLNALGSTFIYLTPEWLKEFAIRRFGQHDKDALKAGMTTTIVVVAIVIGLVARWRPRVAVGLTVVLIAVTAAAGLTRPTSRVIDIVPILLGGAVGIGFLVTACRRSLQAPDRKSVPAATDGANRWNRRQFLTFAGAGAAATALGGVLARWIPSGEDVAASRARTRVPTPVAGQQIPAGVDQRVPDQPPFITPNASFYRVDTAFSPPNLTAEDWSLTVHGLVDTPLSINYADLMARPQIERTITLTCVSNEVGGDLAGTATWIGARIDDLLKQAGPQVGADCVLCTSVDGFTISAPLDALTDGRDALLAVAMNGEILPQVHGFPVRMVVPGLYGYVSATKWVVDMEITQFSKVVAYWTARGWSDHGPIKTASRIDVPRGFAQVPSGRPVVLAGVAWAQHRGIDSVQLQVDDGDWMEAELSQSLSKDTWRQWRFAWTPTTVGLHTVRCRAVDGTGAVQDATVRPPIPDGSTGYDSRTITVT